MRAVLVGSGWLGLGLVSGCGWFSEPAPVEVVVQVGWPGASTAEVEASLLAPVEGALGGVEGVEHVLGVASEGRATVFVELAARGGADLRRVRAQQAVLERLQALDTLPEAAVTPTVFVQPDAGTAWVKADADDEAVRTAVGSLAGRGLAARALSTPSTIPTWELRPAALREHTLLPGAVVAAVDAALAEGRPVNGELSVGEGVTLSQVARTVDTAPPALLDGQPAGLMIAPTGSSVPGWTRVDDAGAGRTRCGMFFDDPRRTDLPGVWREVDGAWLGRFPAAVEGPGVVSWPCGSTLRRVALLPADPSADRDGLVRALDAWEGSEAVVRVPDAVRPPEVQVRVDEERLRALGVSARAVTDAIGWSGQVRRGAPVVTDVDLLIPTAPPASVVLQWGEDDPTALGEVPLTLPDGQWVPLSAVVTLVLAQRAPAITHLDGRPVAVVDVALRDGVEVSDIALDDVRVLDITGLGPQRSLW